MQQSWREAAAARHALLEAELPALVRSLVALGAKRVVLFGSLARGDVRSTSDIDLLVVLDMPGRFADRLAAVYDAIDPGVGVDALVYTSEELAELSRTRPFVQRVLREGRELYAA